MILNIAQLIITGLLVTTILLQQRGAGVGGAFGGGGSESYYTKRGGERLLFNATIALGVAFFLIALLRHII